MALIFAGSRCALCNEVLEAGVPLFATSGCALPPDDPLLHVCDAPIHWRCYSDWPERGRFARAYFDAKCESAARNSYWGTVFRDGEVLVTVNPDPAVSQVDVALATLGNAERISLDGWSAWLRTETPADERGEVVREAVENARLHIQALPHSREELAARAEFPPPPPPRTPSRWQELAALRNFNRKARRLAEVARARGLECPHCRALDHRFHDDSSRPSKSFFTCLACARTFTHEDLPSST